MTGYYIPPLTTKKNVGYIVPNFNNLTSQQLFMKTKINKQITIQVIIPIPTEIKLALITDRNQ